MIKKQRASRLLFAAKASAHSQPHIPQNRDCCSLHKVTAAEDRQWKRVTHSAAAQAVNNREAV